MKGFEDHLQDVRERFHDLSDSELFDITEFPKEVRLPGVYVILDQDCPIYVGRTRNLHRRVKEHCSSSVRKAALAVRMARCKTGLATTYKKGNSATYLYENCTAFREAFDGARARIQDMKVRYVIVEDDVCQALLEICAAVEWETPYNSFTTT